MRDYTLAISGEVFRWIIDFANEEIIKRVSALAFLAEDMLSAHSF